MTFPKIRVRFSLTIGDGKPGATGPDIEAQIGTHHDAGPTDLTVGFTTPGTRGIGYEEGKG